MTQVHVYVCADVYLYVCARLCVCASMYSLAKLSTRQLRGSQKQTQKTGLSHGDERSGHRECSKNKPNLTKMERSIRKRVLESGTEWRNGFQLLRCCSAAEYVQQENNQK